jgi:hypothetical protein
MGDLTPQLLGNACRIFLTFAYPGGMDTIPAAKRAFFHLDAEASLEPVLRPPVCALLKTSQGGVRGYALRLGSASYPHLKLQTVSHGAETQWIFSVDTHDSVEFAPGHPDIPGWAKLQTTNQRLKETIERAWESAGLLTFNRFLRQELHQS